MGLFDWLAQDIAGNPSATATYAGQQAVKPTFSVNEQGIGTQISPYVPATKAMVGPVGGVVQPTGASLGKGSSGITYQDIMKSLMRGGGGQSAFLPGSPELGMTGGNVNPSAMQQGQGVFQQLNQPKQKGTGDMLLGMLASYFTGIPGV